MNDEQKTGLSDEYLREEDTTDAVSTHALYHAYSQLKWVRAAIVHAGSSRLGARELAEFRASVLSASGLFVGFRSRS